MEVVRNNIFGYLDELAVSILSSDNIVVSGNEALDVGQGSNAYVDAMSAEGGSSNTQFIGNLIDGAPGNGISLWESSGGHLIRNNTIINAGSGGFQTAGVSVFGECGGYMVLGESESLLDLEHDFQYVKPSVFKRPGLSRTSAFRS